MIYVGIDPGAGGGIAALASDGEVVRAISVPEWDHEILDAVGASGSLSQAYAQRYGEEMPQRRAMLERVWSAPGWGHVGAFSFGGSYRALKMALTATGCPYTEVLPRMWQAAMGVRYPKGVKRDKNITKRRAQRLFPGVKVTHAIADALLIAEHCRRIHEGVE